MRIRRLSLILVAVAALAGAALSLVMLEQQRAGVSAQRVVLAETPVTLWRSDVAKAGPLVVVAHGYAGSRQMMQPVSIALARSGFTVAAFDFHGHGRTAQALRGDITSIEGTTARLVDQTVAVTQAARALIGVVGPVSLVGHSMATDVVIRAGARLGDPAAIVAISMYSDAVTPDSPQRLLIISGAQESRLRKVALDRVRQIDPNATEGETVQRGRVERRAVAAPWVGHVGVLYSRVTLSELRGWISGATGRAPMGALPVIGPWVLGLLVALVALMWPLSRVLGPVVPPSARLGRRGLVALGAPLVPALAAAILVPSGFGGLLAFAPLAAFFCVWGAVQLAMLWRIGERPQKVRALAVGLLLIWGLCVFAPALDRYGAAFVPTGPRLWIMAGLMLGTIPFCIADAVLAARSGWLTALTQRLLPLLVLLGAMMIAPDLGVAFTVLPVMVLFWLVYGLAGRWVAARSDPWSTGLALGVILAWSIAASTPMVAS